MRAEVAFEPLTALAGGILGGLIVATIAWRVAFGPRHTTPTRGAAA